MTQFVVEDETPFLVSMIHASRTFWMNCFFCVVRYPDIWDYEEADDKVSQGLFLTRLSMRNIRDEQGETPLMEACGPDDETQHQVQKG